MNLKTYNSSKGLKKFLDRFLKVITTDSSYHEFNEKKILLKDNGLDGDLEIEVSLVWEGEKLTQRFPISSTSTSDKEIFHLTMTTYLVGGKEVVVPSYICPSCYGYWEKPRVSCPLCLRRISCEIKFLIKSLNCPLCSKKILDHPFVLTCHQCQIHFNHKNSIIKLPQE
jgi:hypothetical protein